MTASSLATSENSCILVAGKSCLLSLAITEPLRNIREASKTSKTHKHTQTEHLVSLQLNLTAEQHYFNKYLLPADSLSLGVLEIE